MSVFPDAIKRLVEHFDRQIDQVQSPDYNEAQLRIDFINPMFRELGWDLDNTQHFAEQYREVVYEDRVRVGGTTKAPDYSFRIGGPRKFFLEAKKPSVNLKSNPEPAYQLRRYGWSAKLAISLLTNFAELAVYDCRVQPKHLDSAATARRDYITYHQYEERWDFIAGTFSKQAVMRGDFDRYCGAARGRGVQEFDEAFLVEIEEWRNRLASNLALRNNSLDEHFLNFAVQRIIDRIIFLRICEDRGIERVGRLQALLGGEEVYPRLLKLFRDADDRYNSGLFHFRQEKARTEPPDELTPELEVDDVSLKAIIRRLYYPESPYEFTVVSADILGSVYERFLGKVITLTSAHRAKVEEKPEVRKAGGVYYTPTYIVDYIVQQTVGKLLENARNPVEAAKIAVLDPACGSGSFLLGAYQFLLDWHLKWYLANRPEDWSKGKKAALRPGGDGQWRLTINERKRILLDNIHGVDIDYQAVEVTKLSLLLKVLEGETAESLGGLWAVSHERALPDLGRNIQCGNSLIGTDIMATEAWKEMSEDERRTINPFDLHRGFPGVFKKGGFDAVIGNPPYVRIQGFPRNQIDYLTRQYKSASGNCDLYVSFIERGFDLLAPTGILGEILPNKFFRTDYGRGLRDLLSKYRSVTRIVDFGAEQVFDATTYTCLLFLSKRQTPYMEYTHASANREALASAAFSKVPSDSLSGDPWGFASDMARPILEKLARHPRLLDLPADMSRGSSTGADDVFIFESRSLEVEPAILREPLFATDFGRYRFDSTSKWQVIFPYVHENGKYRLYTEGELKASFPNAFRYLRSHMVELKKRKQFSAWFGYSAPRNLELHDQAQILVPLLANEGLCALMPKNSVTRRCPMASAGFTISMSESCRIRPEYILGLLNSRLLFWKLRQISNIFRGGWVTCTKQYVGELPIRSINFSDAVDVKKHDHIVGLVNSMLSLNKKAQSAKLPHAKEQIRRQIETTDHQIDHLVYELYGLTDEEIRVVESATNASP